MSGICKYKIRQEQKHEQGGFAADFLEGGQAVFLGHPVFGYGLIPLGLNNLD